MQINQESNNWRTMTHPLRLKSEIERSISNESRLSTFLKKEIYFPVTTVCLSFELVFAFMLDLEDKLCCKSQPRRYRCLPDM